jgi:hypothetical protein
MRQESKKMNDDEKEKKRRKENFAHTFSGIRDELMYEKEEKEILLMMFTIKALITNCFLSSIAI